MAFWMQETQAFYRVRTMTTLQLALIMAFFFLILGAISFWAILYPMKKKLQREVEITAKMALQKNALELTLRQSYKPSACGLEPFSSPSQCAHFFIGSCTKNHLVCHSLKTSHKKTKYKSSKCFITAQLKGTFAHFNTLIKQLEVSKSIKLKSISLKNTSQGVLANCYLRFSLVSQEKTS